MFSKKLYSVFAPILLSMVLVFSSCDDDNDDVQIMQPTDIIDLAVASSDLSILVEAVQKAGLVDALKADGPYTVFAPTNEAFQALLNSNADWNSLDDIPMETLDAVLKYHVVSGVAAMSSDLTDGQEIETLNGGIITIDLSNGVQIKTIAEQSVSVTIADIEASNGVIHVIDEVMLPIEPEQDIVDLAVATPDLSILVEAVQKAGLVDALKADGPYTVFAPTNAAFQALLDSNADWNSLDDIPMETLDAVLKYHVVSGVAAMSSDLTDGQEIETLNGGIITIDLSNGVQIKTIAEQSVSVITADVEGSNGVVHIIDEVMLPIEPEQDIVDLAVATPDLSILVEAVQKAGLVDALKADGPYTVFAPTNAAFQALLDSNADWNSLDDIPMETLTSVLLFHVVSGKVMSTDLSDTYVNTLATGPNNENISLQVTTTGGVKFNNEAMPTTVDVEGSNGVVHIIDTVMLPPSIVTLALNNSGFTSLVAALTDLRHTTDFVSVLSSAGPFTVFAPTNAAFQALLDSNNNWNSLGDIPIETLDAVLKYHVVNNANVQSDELTNGQEITMLNDGMLTVDLSSGAMLKTSSNQEVNIILTNVQGTNGVIHAVDMVLIPSASTESKTFDVTNNGFSSYIFNGDGLTNASNPDFTFKRGGTYTFNVNTPGHPFFINSVQGTGTANTYSSGVTNNGAATGTITFTVPMDAPNTLYYNCEFHGSMTGMITITD